MALLDSKFQPWKNVQEQLDHVIRTTDPEEHSVMVPYGLQLAHTLHHPHVVRCMTFYHCPNGNNYVTHMDTGVVNEIYVWQLSTLQDEEVKCQRVRIGMLMSKILFVPQHRVFVGYSPDVTLHVFSDLNNNCMSLTKVHCSETILCMAYNEDMDELITGGRGFIQAWKMTHVEIRDPLVRGRPIESQITEDDWVRDVRVDRKRRQLLALCDEGIHIIDYRTNREKYCIKNWHASALTCFVFYYKLEYCITASMDGAIKVWNAVVFKEVHEFIGHYASVTGLVIHPSDPLLVSSSKDGTVRIWRLDTFELTHRLNVGEKILGMKLANPHQLFYFTLHDIKVWNFNQYHHLFTPIRSCVHKLARIISPSTPSRVLCCAEDGGVRVISATSGTLLTIIYPMPSYQVLTDIVYDPKNALLITVLEMGDVLVFDSSTNPCQARELLLPMVAEESIKCLALVKQDCALGRVETPDCDYLIFAGHASGQISLLEARSHSMRHPVQAHGGQVLGLECSHGAYHDRQNYVGCADRLLSFGTERMVKIWEVGLGNTPGSIKLTCLKLISCSISPSYVSMLSNVLCTVLPTNAIEMYEFTGDEMEVLSHCTVSVKDLASRIATGLVPGITMLTHLKDHDHTQQITSLCSCPSREIFATTSDDGTLKIWDLSNTLVRELSFDSSLRSVCFANMRGDLLVGFQNHISYVTIECYLPLSHMEALLDQEIEDEIVEEPFPFNPDLPLWFNLKELPTFPTDLCLRRLLRKKLPQLKKQLLAEEEREKTQEEGGRVKDGGDEGVIEEGDSLCSVYDGESVLKVTEHSLAQIPEVQEPVAMVTDGSETVPDQHGTEREQMDEGSMGKEQQGEERSPQIESSPQDAAVQDVTDEGYRTDEVDSNLRRTDTESLEETDSPPFNIIESTPEQDEEEERSGTKEGDETGEIEEEEEKKEEEEEEKKVKLPIAPDGYIPNSVIRMIVKPPKPPPPPTPPEEWKLNKVHMAEDSLTQQQSDETDYESHEPFTWASSEESSGGHVTPVSSPSPTQMEAFVPSALSRKAPQQSVKIEEEARPRRLSIKTVGMLVLSHPGFSEEREKTGTPKKKKRKGRGINVTGTPVRKYGKVGDLGVAHEEREEKEEEKKEEEEEESCPLNSLQNKITDNYWYPKGLKMDTLTIVATLLNLLDNASEEEYKGITAALLELHNLVGLRGTLLDSIVRKYVRELKSSLFETRLEAIRTLTSLGDDRPIVVLSVLNSMADQEDAVQQEAAAALSQLAGISTRHSMEEYLANVGILQPQTVDPLDDLAMRFRRETQEGKTKLHDSASLIMERRLSSQAAQPAMSYSPTMIEGWLRDYLGNKNLYKFKGKHGKPHAPILKKKRRMSLQPRPRQPLIGAEGAVKMEIEEEDFEDEDSEEGEEDEDSEEGEEDEFWSEEEDEEESEDLSEEKSELESLEEQFLPNVPQPVKMTKHQAMMKAKEATAKREKALMEKRAKEQMRKHIEEYELAKKKKNKLMKIKHLLPTHPLFYKYYAKPEVASGEVLPRRKKIKSILRTVASIPESETSTSIAEAASSSEACEQISYLSMSAKTSLPVGIAHMESTTAQGVVLERGPGPGDGERVANFPVVAERGPGAGVEERKVAVAPARRIRKGVCYLLDKKRWGWQDEDIIAEGKGSSRLARLNTPSSVTKDDSGLGDSMATGTGTTSQLLTATDTGTSDSLLGITEASKLSGSGGMKNIHQDQMDRPRSELTRANLRRHELLSAHGEGELQPVTSKKAPKENWRDFFRLPAIQMKRQHHEALRELREGQTQPPQKPLTFKCIPSGVTLTPGSSKNRILQDMSIGVKREGQVQGHGWGQGHSQGQGGSVQKLELCRMTTSRKQGVTDYGALQMTWSNMVPRSTYQPMSAPRPVGMETGRSHPSMGYSSQKVKEEWAKYEEGKKNWLRTQLLYPSLFQLQELDYIKHRISCDSRARKGNLFRWETPMPTLICTGNKGQRLPGCPVTLPEDWKKSDVKVPCKMCEPTVSLPSIVQSEQIEEDNVPIVPRNSIASTTCDSYALPRIQISKKIFANPAVKTTPQQPLEELPSQS